MAFFIKRGFSLIDDDKTRPCSKGDPRHLIGRADDETRSDDKKKIALIGVPEGFIQLFLGERIAEIALT